MYAPIDLEQHDFKHIATVVLQDLCACFSSKLEIGVENG